MLLLLILPLLISGYCVQQWNYNHFYQLHRYSGQLLYLKSAFLGAVCLATSFICCSLLLSIKPFTIFGISIGFDLLAHLTSLLENTLNIKRASLPFYILLTIFTFLVAFIWSHGENFINIILRYLSFNDGQFKLKEGKKAHFKDKWEIARLGFIFDIKQRVFCENPLDALFIKSYEQSQDIMLNMSDRKVYIGFVMTLSEPNEFQSLAQEIAIFPLKSGYRDKDNLTVTITTNYKREDALFIILRREEILSATIYDKNIFQNFQQNSVIKYAEEKFKQRIENNKIISTIN
ncbi:MULTISPECIES: hypothetical protein [Acinetobacter]|uniref:hypothetical protein n=1 Tax=Acinetobacter TaxID=469 RepID=UPI001CD30580|nr:MULTISPECIES: hypothetical protein [Acinetobacter]